MSIFRRTVLGAPRFAGLVRSTNAPSSRLFSKKRNVAIGPGVFSASFDIAISKSFSRQTTPSASLFIEYVDRLRSSGVKHITADEIAEIYKYRGPDIPSPVLHVFDVREPYEWNEERIPSAIYTGRGNLEKEIEARVPNQNEKIILYCVNGTRSTIAADALTRMGYKDVSFLEGGLTAWKKKGLTLTKNYVDANAV
ncbi:Rhodanese-like domain-containing protein [Zopfochytrium polystomum]|nr:Rhodanese-like domain-containing protein [Zopfochytrium polystomum]